MTYLFTPLTWLSSALEAAKGQRTLKKLSTVQHPSDGYRVVFSDGSIIAIFCSEIIYLVSYAAWWARSHRLYIYTVYSTCTSDTPPDLKARFSKEFSITNVLSYFSTQAARKKAAIDAYVDILIEEAQA